MFLSLDAHCIILVYATRKQMDNKNKTNILGNESKNMPVTEN